MDWLAGCGTGGPGGTAVGAAMGRALGLLAGYSPADLTPSSSDIQTLVTAAEYIKALATSLPPRRTYRFLDLCIMLMDAKAREIPRLHPYWFLCLGAFTCSGCQKFFSL